MVIPGFTFSKVPKIFFGAGQFQKTDTVIRYFGHNVLIVTGSYSFKASGNWDTLHKVLKSGSFHYLHYSVHGEPSPDAIDAIVSQVRDKPVDVVLAIGGGSVLDAGKAISAMIPQSGSVFDYLEGVGTKVHDGRKIPYVAIPTTSGTGSEVTKNAVLSKIGVDGFKRSLRHDMLVPDSAIIDPALLMSCPSDITASCGMDAFTQLLESYVSVQSTPLTDALALSGLKAFKDTFILACTSGSKDIESRAGMAYASLLSGITLANAGLGIVHGYASSIGGLFDIPHGVICGSLIGPATKITIHKLKQCDPENSALDKYAQVGALLHGSVSTNKEYLCDLLIEKIEEWTDAFNLSDLKKYGINTSALETIVSHTTNKNNPLPLDSAEMTQILLNRL
ncbi:MAG: iron-containing alcohol dehydrogenase [bacterium]